jgi:hypothetical protein
MRRYKDCIGATTLRQLEDTRIFCDEGYDGVETTTTTHNQIIKRRIFSQKPCEHLKEGLKMLL